jgi:hypothetical protein
VQFEHSCLEHGADLIVTGAFTRQRSRVPAVGSLTGEMIRQVTWPVFMATSSLNCRTSESGGSIAANLGWRRRTLFSSCLHSSPLAVKHSR